MLGVLVEKSILQARFRPQLAEVIDPTWSITGKAFSDNFATRGVIKQRVRFDHGHFASAKLSSLSTAGEPAVQELVAQAHWSNDCRWLAQRRAVSRTDTLLVGIKGSCYSSL